MTLQPALVRLSAVLSMTGLMFCAMAADPSGTAPSDSGPVRQAPVVLRPSEAGVGRWVPDFSFKLREGRPLRLSEIKSARGTVIAFTSTSCPVSRRYLPTLAALSREYTAKGFDFVFINAIGTDPDSDIDGAMKTLGHGARYVVDRDLSVARALGARSTAEVLVLDTARTVVYRGAVDDQYGLGYSKEAPSKRYLVEALEALGAGREVTIEATTAPGCVLESASAPAAGPAVITYHNRISRILQRHCVECHHEGGNAPFALETSAEVAAHAGMIRKVVTAGVMPPWFAARLPGEKHGMWANDRSLSEVDRRDLLAWLEQGRPEGNATEAPRVVARSKDWEIGKPDVVYQIPEPIRVKATGRMPYQEVMVETGLEEDRWVQALEVRPTARDVVHHVLVFVLPPEKGTTNGAPRKRRSAASDGGNFFAVYVPGNNVLRYPVELAKSLPKGSALQFQIHYTPKGTETMDQTRLGLVFAKAPPKHEVRVAAITPIQLRIPARAANHEVAAMLPVPFEARLLSFMPHMHLRGKAYRYELEDPRGARTVLLDVPRYDFNWQIQYRLAEPVSASAGSRLRGTAWFDNSAGNPANPDPDRDVKWGIQTDDEMALGYLEYFIPSIPAGSPLPGTAGGRRDRPGFFETLDRNGDGVITADESPDPAVFGLADADGDGKVTKEELRTLLRSQRRR